MRRRESSPSFLPLCMLFETSGGMFDVKRHFLIPNSIFLSHKRHASEFEGLKDILRHSINERHLPRSVFNVHNSCIAQCVIPRIDLSDTKDEGGHFRISSRRGILFHGWTE